MRQPQRSVNRGSRRRGAKAAMAVGLLGALAASPSLAEDGADLVLRNGRFHTVSSLGTVEGGLAVRGGRIVYLGSDAGAAALVGARTRVIDLAGRAVVPGLIDAHSHLLGLGRALESVDLRGAPSYEVLVGRVAAAAARVPAGTWVYGRSWDQNLWPGGQFPEHGGLSLAVPAHPVWLQRVDGHAALLNAAAMTALGIDRSVVDPSGGRFLRAADGAPTGVLIDNAMDAVAARLPQPSTADLQRWLAGAAQHCIARGLTTVTDMGVGAPALDLYQAAVAGGQLPLRVAAFLEDDAALEAQWFGRGPLIDPASRLVVRGVKLYADGALGSRGAALLEPYADDPGNLGLLLTNGDHIEEVARRARRHGFQIGVHAIGDRGNVVALDALERALGSDGDPRAARWRLEHAQVMRAQDIQRMARLGIVASMQPTHATSDMPWAEDRVGPRRIEGAYAWRQVLSAGGRLALGSDFPVESADPLLGLYAAVTRQDVEGRPEGGWRPGEKLSRDEALRGFTADAAWSLFLDEEVGSIEAGKRADLVVFDRDLMAVEESEIPRLRVEWTILDGSVVYERRR